MYFGYNYHKVQSAIKFPRIFGFCRKITQMKNQQCIEKDSKNNGLYIIFVVFGIKIYQQGVNVVLSFILSSFYFLIICANFPFRLSHLQSTFPPVPSGHMAA